MFKCLEMIWASMIIEHPDEYSVEQAPKMIRENVRKIVEESVSKD